MRPYLIATQGAVPLSSQLAALLLERIYDLLTALLVFGFALSQIQRSEVQAGPALGWVLADRRQGGRRRRPALPDSCCC